MVGEKDSHLQNVLLDDNLYYVLVDDQQHEEALHDGGSVSTLHLRSLEYLDQWLDLGVEFPVS